ncbi:hypothetical protein ACFVAV_33230 [Nocardia sp. NPDC057663]|uniref:hypothetical protein n=1 Tax=Nocardia sp. NPDC057663 TaxID=3346201 RepID=UPI0036733C4E
MSVTKRPPPEKDVPPPAPQPVHPLLALVLGLDIAAVVGLLTDWQTAAGVLAAVLSLFGAQRR